MQLLFSLAIAVALGFAEAEVAKSKGYVKKYGEPKIYGDPRMLYVTWWICGSLCFIVAIIWILSKPSIVGVYDSDDSIEYNGYDNYNDYQSDVPVIERSSSAAGIPTVQKKTSPADEIRKYKDLLDLGAITPEEYEAKKKQLLGL